MSFSTQTNKWTPKLIVIFQLTVWSVVGILLLRKGAKSLRAIEETLRNDTADTQERIAKRNEDKLIQDSGITENRHRIAEIVTRRKEVVLALDGSETARRNGIWLSLKPYAPHRADGISVGKQTTIDRKQDPRGIRAIQTLNIRTSNENKDEQRNKRGSSIRTIATSDQSFYVEETTTTIDEDTSSVLFQSNSDTANFTALTSTDKFEKKLQRTPVNRIGVAVAITMLAIGVVMLLLGPLIVILRAYGDRRRCRQTFLKSRCHADRPPTYEEAVLMDQAPRYSTLQLDTTFESSFSL
ncbi:uncharacterized protein LOC116431541 [Nomia melanderi]|uniref:uncharacterized protein LOC116431541 n=1 Tax=Nomia melanderi TaxID=2448451 RepID=UPI001304170D|nr:uncharacterized protein LOC116431541 [Nomia melanderi]XP_031843000.1 uncharacterized protein LOC116431541 [Nomia melanderi]XP_031843001.1 uncharacterized protein LOC116431541 [Nomia melanderi]XP_031843002.1 uncharacterized protein LOC116431541 [Nomia melanderi]XP_031843003.1 uncharacterized protein LOC116431541 [Nomia melanderi]XP_031843004.1 uncharacterized protein LOC116431541 [Nomia melanderi]